MAWALGKVRTKWFHSTQVPASLLALITMAAPSVHEPLLSNGVVEPGYSKSRPLLPSLAKWVLKSLMWILLVTWVAFIFFFPSEFVRHFFSKWTKITEGSIFGITGSIFLIFSGPILIIALLAFVYIIFFSGDYIMRKSPKFPVFRLRTFPVLVDGHFGVVCAGEFLGILLFSVYVLWSISAYTLQAHNLLSKLPWPTKELCCLMLEFIGLRLGSIGLYCLAFLFLPVARGSVLLRLIDIPFEHATRYHVWLGHLTMGLFTLHGVFYIIAWAMEGHLIHKMLEWKNIGIANLPGVISLLAGLLMWVTSLHPVRKKYFELFFYTHQLYVVFIVFLAMHVGDFIFSMAAAGIFLFILDRFVRFCQSRTTVDIISAACRPCGTVELILSKPSNLRYNALSFVFLQVRELSWLQWHPFSVSSSPLEGRNHLSILIKVLGEWTEKLRDIITNAQKQPDMTLDFEPHKITASVEGPYGHEIAYHLMYENLILVAGGIGISPFLAILSDILHCIRDRRPCLPKNVLVIWAVKKSKELSLITVVDSQSISPSFSDRLNLDIKAYVTQESEPSLEEGNLLEKTKVPSFSVANEGSMSCLVGTGNNIWSGIYFIVSLVGFIILYGLLEIYYINPLGVSSWWYRGLLFTLCMVASVVIFGGVVVFLWHHWERRSSSYNQVINDEKASLGTYHEKILHDESSGVALTSLMTTRYRCRPDFQEIFNSFSRRLGLGNVGVIVCGPPGLQSSVAKECRSQNLKGRWNGTAFHFHSHSFDL